MNEKLAFPVVISILTFNGMCGVSLDKILGGQSKCVSKLLKQRRTLTLFQHCCAQQPLVVIQSSTPDGVYCENFIGNSSEFQTNFVNIPRDLLVQIPL